MTKQRFKRSALRHKPRHLMRQLFSGWPWFIWLGTAIAVLLLLPGGMNRIRFHGVAERTYEYVSPIESGRLKSLLVDLGDTVHEGQLIGELDNEALAIELLMDQASLMKTRDKIHAIRYDVESMKLEQARTEAELATLEARWARTEGLLQKNLILEQEIEDLRPQIAATREIITHYPRLIVHLKNRLGAAEKDAKLFNAEKLKQLQDLQGQLTARSAGVVAEVLHQPGDVVKTGSPVIRISNVSTTRVIAFMPEENRMDLQAGERCRVIASASRAHYLGQVKSVTADIRKLPVFTGFNDQILRGRRIVIELSGGAELLPGEQVVVVPEVSVFDQWFGRK